MNEGSMKVGDLDRYRGLGVRPSKELARLAGQALVRRAEVELAADLQAARAHGLAFVASQALHAVAMVSQVELQLGDVLPAARGRLAAVGDTAAMGLAQIVADTARAVNR